MQNNNKFFPDNILSEFIGKDVSSFSEAEKYALLARIFNRSNGILICGSYGKSYISRLLKSVLSNSGFSPTLIDMGRNREISRGNGGFCILNPGNNIELISLLKPSITVLTGIDTDSRDMPEQCAIYENVIKQSTVGVVINSNCIEASTFQYLNPNTLLYSLRGKADFIAKNVKIGDGTVSFTTNRCDIVLNATGRLSIPSALAAICVCDLLGIPRDSTVSSINSYKDSTGQLSKIGVMAGISLYYDEADTPHTVGPVISSLHEINPERMFIVFYPDERYGKMEIDYAYALARSIRDSIKPGDIVCICDVFSNAAFCEDIVKSLKREGIEAYSYRKRRDVIKDALLKAQFSDSILLLGRRDKSFDDFCSQIWTVLENKIL